MVRIGNKRDFYSGLVLIGFGLAALSIARNYRMGTALRMGPGYFPIVLSSLLILIGIIVAGLALRSDEVTSPKLALRPLLIVTGATVFFGVFIDGAGMVLATLGMVVASRLARPGYPWLETAILAAGLTALCVAVFYFGIRIQMPLLPTWWD